MEEILILIGLIAAVLLGTSMFALGNIAWFGTLIAFFISSSLLSKLKHQRKSAAESGYAKGGRRDAGQVAANGGLGLLLCIGNAIWPDPVWWVDICWGYGNGQCRYLGYRNRRIESNLPRDLLLMGNELQRELPGELRD